MGSLRQFSFQGGRVTAAPPLWKAVLGRSLTDFAGRSASGFLPADYLFDIMPEAREPPLISGTRSLSSEGQASLSLSPSEDPGKTSTAEGPRNVLPSSKSQLSWTDKVAGNGGAKTGMALRFIQPSQEENNTNHNHTVREGERRTTGGEQRTEWLLGATC